MRVNVRILTPAVGLAGALTGLLSASRSPLDLLVAYNFHNDPEISIYLEGTLRFVVAGFHLRAVAGGVAGRAGTTMERTAPTS